MANERITEDYVRAHFKNDPLFSAIKLDEQKSSVAKARQCLTKASKNLTGKGGYTVQRPQHSGNVITVNRNGNGVAEAFYQPVPFSSTEDVHVFKPKFELNKFRAMFLLPLFRMEKYRFNYGRKWGLARMNDSLIRLPVTPQGEPDWLFMETYIKSLPYSKSI